MGSNKRSLGGLLSHWWEQILTGGNHWSVDGPEMGINSQQAGKCSWSTDNVVGQGQFWRGGKNLPCTWGLRNTIQSIWSFLLSSYTHLESSARWEFSDHHPVLHDKPDFVRLPSPLDAQCECLTVVQPKTHGEQSTSLASLDTKTTQLALERLNPETTPVEKAGEASTESTGH